MNRLSAYFPSKTAPLLCILIPLSLLLQGCTREITEPRAQKGFIDVTTIPVNEIVRLNGEWEFYWNRLLTPDQLENLKTSPQYLNIPGSWARRVVEGKKLNGKGFATFRLRIRVPQNCSYLLKIYSIHSAWKLWINGELRDSCGIVGTSAQTMKPKRDPSIIDLPVVNEELELIMQISNFHYRAGGINTPVVLGPVKSFIKSDHRQAAIEFFLSGAILIMALYHLMIFSARKKDKASLFFGLFSILILFRILVTGELFSASMCGLTDYRLNIQIEYLTVYIPVMLFILYCAQLFPSEVKKLPVRLSLLTGTLFSLATIFTPAWFFTHLMPVYHPVLLVQFVWLTIAIALSAARSRQGAVLMLCGFIFIFLAALYDMMFTWRAMEGKYVLPAGIFIFLVSQTYILSKRFAFAYKTIGDISRELSSKNEQLLRLSKLKDDFLARVTHELRTPLYGIIGTAEMILEREGKNTFEFMRKGFQIIEVSAKRLSRLVNDILDFSKLENGEIMLFKKNVDLYSLTQNIIILLENSTSGKNIKIENAIPKDLAPVFADEDRLQQIFYNIIGNSIKFTHKGKITVSAAMTPEIGSLFPATSTLGTESLPRTDVEGSEWRMENTSPIRHCSDTLTISIADTGIGIPENKLGTIFDSFIQADASDSSGYGGKGLGLSITKHLVQLHGGTIEILSKAGHGTIVNFTLPVTGDSNPESAGREDVDTRKIIPDEAEEKFILSGQKPESGDRSCGIVLIADDDPVSIQLIADALFDVNFSIKTVQDGDSVLEAVEKEELPDLVIMDMMMPGMSGLECTRILRQKYNSSQLPIIMLTARNQLSDLVHGFESGVNDFLTKPFHRPELLLRVKTWIELKKAYMVLKENQKLQAELKIRRKKEYELMILQKKLSYMLDMIEEAILALDEDGIVRYVNKQGERALGYAGDMLSGRPFSSLLDGQYTHMMEHIGLLQDGSRIFDKVCLLSGSGKPVSFRITVTGCEYEDGHLSILTLKNGKMIKRKEITANEVFVESFVSELSGNTERFRLFRETLGKLNPELFRKNPQLRGDLALIDSTLSKLQICLNTGNSGVEKKSFAVRMFCLAIDLWIKKTNLTKADLAGSSGLWNVQVNADGWKRTQTLDKYLDIGTMPRNPRWKLVDATVEYVIACLDEGQQEKLELEKMLFAFRLMV